MDYEKKYNEALERARKIHDEIVNNEVIGFPGQITDIFPELAESEDEKAKKIIASVFSEAGNRYIQKSERDIVLAYLEKQKEIPMPNSTELIEMWHKEKAMLKEKDFRGDEWRLAYNAFMDGFARGTCVKFEKQKEPSWKPSEAQLNALNFAITYFMHETNYKNPTELRELYDDLKKLMEDEK